MQWKSVHVCYELYPGGKSGVCYHLSPSTTCHSTTHKITQESNSHPRCHRHPPSEMMNISWQPKLISIEIIVFPMIVIIVIIAIILTVSMSVLPHCDGRHLTGYHHLFTGPATRAKIIIWQRRRKNMFKKVSAPQLFLQQPSAPHQKVDTWTGRKGNRSWFMQVWVDDCQE